MKSRDDLRISPAYSIPISSSLDAGLVSLPRSLPILIASPPRARTHRLTSAASNGVVTLSPPVSPVPRTTRCSSRGIACSHAASPLGFTVTNRSIPSSRRRRRRRRAPRPRRDPDRRRNRTNRRRRRRGDDNCGSSGRQSKRRPKCNGLSVRNWKVRKTPTRVERESGPSGGSPLLSPLFPLRQKSTLEAALATATNATRLCLPPITAF